MMSDFGSVRRQEFRRFYQPTRILLGVVLGGPHPSGVNVITLCFTASCSYKPPMMMLAVQRHALSYELFQKADQCVLAVPGENLAEQTLLCGTLSGREIDKVRECGFSLLPSRTVCVPGLVEAIANLEVIIKHRVETGDHLTLMGRVARFAVNKTNRQRNLVSVGPHHDGYRVLASKGIHRIAVVDPDLHAAEGDLGSRREVLCDR